MAKSARGQGPLELEDHSCWALEASQTIAIQMFIRWNTKLRSPFWKLWLGKCTDMAGYLEVPLTFPHIKTDGSGGELCLLEVMGERKAWSISKITSVLPEGQLGGDTSANGGLCSVLGKAAAFSVVWFSWCELPSGLPYFHLHLHRQPTSSILSP